MVMIKGIVAVETPDGGTEVVETVIGHTKKEVWSLLGQLRTLKGATKADFKYNAAEDVYVNKKYIITVCNWPYSW